MELDKGWARTDDILNWPLKPVVISASGSSVCHAVAYALLRDLTNYYWHVQDDELERQQELHSLIQEISTTETNEFIVEVTVKSTEITADSLIPSLKQASPKDVISNDNIIGNESTSPSENHAILKQCSLSLENPRVDSDHCCDEPFSDSITSENTKIELSKCFLEENESTYPDHKSSEGLFEEDENNQIVKTPLKQITCGDFVDSWALNNKDHKSSETLEIENTIIESGVLQETSTNGSVEINKSESGINYYCCEEYNVDTAISNNKDGKEDPNPGNTNSTPNSMQENIEKRPVLERLDNTGLGIIETFSDVGSICFDDKFLQGLTPEKPSECSKKEIGTDIEASAVKNESFKTYCCLHALYFDAGDDMRNDLLSENQLQTVETGSVSDWLYSVTGSPPVCLLQSDEILSVTQEEIESIQEQEKIYDICKATDEIMLKQIYVNQWLIDTNDYICSKKLFGDGDFM